VISAKPPSAEITGGSSPSRAARRSSPAPAATWAGAGSPPAHAFSSGAATLLRSARPLLVGWRETPGVRPALARRAWRACQAGLIQAPYGRRAIDLEPHRGIDEAPWPHGPGPARGRVAVLRLPLGRGCAGPPGDRLGRPRTAQGGQAQHRAQRDGPGHRFSRVRRQRGLAAARGTRSRRQADDVRGARRAWQARVDRAVLRDRRARERGHADQEGAREAAGGGYRITGAARENGKRVGRTAGKAWLTHDIPEGPPLVSPAEGPPRRLGASSPTGSPCPRR